MNAYDVIIIGSGHNALVAACYLAQAGKKVLILEKNEEIGGATASVRAFALKLAVYLTKKSVVASASASILP